MADKLQELLDTELQHFGTRGMRWGSRKSGVVTSARGAAKVEKRSAKADKKWEKNIYTTKGAVAVHNAVATSINPKLAAFNASPKYKGMNLITHPDSPAAKRYVKDYTDLVTKETSAAVIKVHGTSPSGKKKAVLDTSWGQWKVTVVDVEVRHAIDELNPDLTFLVQHDNSGFIKSMDLEEAMAQSEEFDMDYLEHFGTRGMRWGVRRSTSGTSSGRRGTSSAGSKDFKKARKLGKKGTKNLSTKELQDLTKRLQLEKQYKELKPSDLKKGMSIVKGVTAAGTTVASLYALSRTPLGQDIVKAVTKKLG